MQTLLILLWITIGVIALYFATISNYAKITLKRIVHYLLLGPIALVLVILHDKEQIKAEELIVSKHKARKCDKDIHLFLSIVLLLSLSSCSLPHTKTVAVRNIYNGGIEDARVHELVEVGDTINYEMSRYVIIKDYSNN